MRTASLLIAAAALLSSVAGCAADQGEDDSAESTESELRNGPRPGQGQGHGGWRGWHGGHGRGKQEVPHKEGNFFVEVKANGPGCPAGTWEVAISEDGETFTMTWSAYEAKVEPGKAMDIKNCVLDIDLGSPGQGMIYSIAAFHYQGYVFLEKEGMNAEQVARYNWRGNNDKKQDRTFAGPFDDSYLFTDEINQPRRQWSSCRRDDSLRINTALKITNDRDRTGTGYANAQSLDASKMALTFKLEHKKCR